MRRDLQACARRPRRNAVTRLSAQQCAVILVNYNNAADSLEALTALAGLRTPPFCLLVADNGSRPEDSQKLEHGWRALRRARGLPGPLLCAGAVADQATTNGVGTEALLPKSCGSKSWRPDESHGPEPGPHEPERPGGKEAQPRSQSPAAVLLRLDRNLGFSGGNNAALRWLLVRACAAQCAAFWLLNNDAAPDPAALDALCERLNQRPEAGLCGSTLLYAHAPDNVQAAGGCTFSPLSGRTAFIKGGVNAADLARVRHQEVEKRMAYMVGASLLARREVFERVGLLPEEYFLYYEDLAFALNARRAGFALAWARESLVPHKEGGSTGASGGGGGRPAARSALVDYLSVRNRIWLIRRYYPWALPAALASLAGVCLNRVRRGQAGRLGLVRRAALDGLRGRMGRPPEISAASCTLSAKHSTQQKPPEA